MAEFYLGCSLLIYLLSRTDVAYFVFIVKIIIISNFGIGTTCTVFCVLSRTEVAYFIFCFIIVIFIDYYFIIVGIGIEATYASFLICKYVMREFICWDFFQVGF